MIKVSYIAFHKVPFPVATRLEDNVAGVIVRFIYNSSSLMVGVRAYFKNKSLRALYRADRTFIKNFVFFSKGNEGTASGYIRLKKEPKGYRKKHGTDMSLQYLPNLKACELIEKERRFIKKTLKKVEREKIRE